MSIHFLIHTISRMPEDEMKNLRTLSTLPTLDDDEDDDDDDDSLFSVSILNTFSESGADENGSVGSCLTNTDIRFATRASWGNTSGKNENRLLDYNDEGGDDEEEKDGNENGIGNLWMSDREYRAPYTNSTRSNGEETLDFDEDDDLISTGSLLSTVQRLKDMLDRAQSTKLELSKQLAGTGVCHDERNILPGSARTMMNSSTDGKENKYAGASACSDNDSAVANSIKNTVTQSNCKSKVTKSKFAFFRRANGGAGQTKTTATSVTKATTKHDVQKNNAELRATISELQKSLTEKEKYLTGVERSLQANEKRVRELNMENHKLAETTARIEVQYMNKMHEMQRDFEGRLKRRDERITYLTWQLSALGFNGGDQQQQSVLKTMNAS